MENFIFALHVYLYGSLITGIIISIMMFYNFFKSPITVELHNISLFFHLVFVLNILIWPPVAVLLFAKLIRFCIKKYSYKLYIKLTS